MRQSGASEIQIQVCFAPNSGRLTEPSQTAANSQQRTCRSTLPAGFLEALEQVLQIGGVAIRRPILDEGAVETGEEA